MAVGIPWKMLKSLKSTGELLIIFVNASQLRFSSCCRGFQVGALLPLVLQFGGAAWECEGVCGKCRLFSMSETIGNDHTWNWYHLHWHSVWKALKCENSEKWQTEIVLLMNAALCCDNNVTAPLESLLCPVTKPQGVLFANSGNIIVATPGRLEDLFRRKADGLDLASCVKSLDVLVLDEADRLLDMGFEAR